MLINKYFGYVIVFRDVEWINKVFSIVCVFCFIGKGFIINVIKWFFKYIVYGRSESSVCVCLYVVIYYSKVVYFWEVCCVWIVCVDIVYIFKWYFYYFLFVFRVYR